MSLWLLSYVGPLRWNINETLVVRALDEEEARTFGGGARADWKCERIDMDGPDWKCERIDMDGPADIIASVWRGDPG